MEDGSEEPDDGPTGYVSRAEAAGRIGVHLRTIDRWLRDPSVRLQIYRRAGRPGHVLISTEELEALASIRASRLES
jgi:hypothetical protein